MNNPSHGHLAELLEIDAADLLAEATITLTQAAPDLTDSARTTHLTAVVQARAALALCQRTAEQSEILRGLTEFLGQYLGDGSHLEGIKQAICEGLEGIRSDGVGVG